MTELYDLIAGSETGGIIAAMLVTPKSSTDKSNRYWATDAAQFFEENVDMQINKCHLYLILP